MEQPLDLLERQELLRLARGSIAATAGREPMPAFALASPTLCTPTAVFVSIHKFRDLRGCVGTTKAEKPLREAVVAMACAAARHDPRFPPVKASELPLLRLEISRLSPFRRVQPEEVDPGRHGIYVVHVGTDSRGLLLPQVASRLGWSRERFLTETCRKAGLPGGEWRAATTEVYVFTAEVFGEDDLET
jgi:AmmeMemoRadiSam system protein A